MSLYKLDPLSGKAFTRTLDRFWDKDFIVVGAKFEIEAMRNLIKKYTAGNIGIPKGNVLYAHAASMDEMSLCQRSKIYTNLTDSDFDEHYLITVPENAQMYDFAAWIEKQMS